MREGRREGVGRKVRKMGYCVLLVLLSLSPLLACFCPCRRASRPGVSSRRLVLACRSRRLVVSSSCVRRRLVVRLVVFLSLGGAVDVMRVCDVGARGPCDDGDWARAFVVLVLLACCPPFAYARRDTIVEAAMPYACLLACRVFLFGVGMGHGWGDRRWG